MKLLERLSEEDPAIAQAKRAMEEMAADPRTKEIYEQRLKAIMDKKSDLYEAEKKGKLEGGLEGRLEAARNALIEGIEPNIVAKITGLSPETVEKLKKEQL